MVSRGISTSHEPQATCRFQKPPPQPSPKGRGTVSNANYKLRAFCQPQTTGYEPQAKCRSFPIPRTRPAGPAEIRGPCRTSHQDTVAVVPFAPSSRSPRVACYGPSCHYQPRPRAKYHAPTGRTRGSAPTSRKTTSYKPRTTTTSHRPQATSYEPRTRSERVTRCGLPRQNHHVPRTTNHVPP